jgi:AbrB family looped-hinge helix DNA binding protein
MATTRLKTRLSSKGQLIIPKEVRDRHGWGPGTELIVEDEGGGVTLRAAEDFPVTTIDQIAGMLKYDGPPKTVEEMDEGILRAIQDEWR